MTARRYALGDIFEIDFNCDLIGYVPVAHRQRIVH